jgi:hypothetical protein
MQFIAQLAAAIDILYACLKVDPSAAYWEIELW